MTTVKVCVQYEDDNGNHQPFDDRVLYETDEKTDSEVSDDLEDEILPIVREAQEYSDGEGL